MSRVGMPSTLALLCSCGYSGMGDCLRSESLECTSVTKLLCFQNAQCRTWRWSAGWRQPSLSASGQLHSCYRGSPVRARSSCALFRPLAERAAAAFRCCSAARCHRGLPVCSSGLWLGCCNGWAGAPYQGCVIAVWRLDGRALNSSLLSLRRAPW
jgi:hypothetical protein